MELFEVKGEKQSLFKCTVEATCHANLHSNVNVLVSCSEKSMYVRILCVGLCPRLLHTLIVEYAPSKPNGTPGC